MKRFETAYAQSAKGERLAAANQTPQALAKWGDYVGDSFAAYT